jgi:hypothetical protein
MTTLWPGDESAKLKTHPVSGAEVLCHEAWTGAALSTAWVERIEKVSVSELRTPMNPGLVRWKENAVLELHNEREKLLASFLTTIGAPDSDMPQLPPNKDPVTLERYTHGINHLATHLVQQLSSSSFLQVQLVVLSHHQANWCPKRPVQCQGSQALHGLVRIHLCHRECHHLHQFREAVRLPG